MPVSTAARVAEEPQERQRDIVSGEEPLPPPRKPVYEGLTTSGVTQKVAPHHHEIIPAVPQRVTVIVGETRTVEIPKGILAQCEKRAWTESELDRKASVERGEAVVANLRTDHTLIDWAKRAGRFVCVDRTTAWGNPFRLDDDGTRAEVIAAYREYYLPHKPSLLRRLRELHGKVLGCWCHPEPCHGDILAAAANSAVDETDGT